MSHDNNAPPPNNRDEFDNFGATAFVVVEEANCLFHPRFDSAISIIPPFGSEVRVIRVAGDWVLIEFFSKQAWSPRENLASEMGRKREPLRVGVSPGFGSWTSNSQSVEYGPRGGRYTRTTSGFRRYF